MDVNIEKLKNQFIKNKQVIEALKAENLLIASFLDLFGINTEELINGNKENNKGRQYGREKETKTKGWF